MKSKAPQHPLRVYDWKEPTAYIIPSIKVKYAKELSIALWKYIRDNKAILKADTPYWSEIKKMRGSCPMCEVMDCEHCPLAQGAFDRTCPLFQDWWRASNAMWKIKQEVPILNGYAEKCFNKRAEEAKKAANVIVAALEEWDASMYDDEWEAKFGTRKPVVSEEEAYNPNED